MKRADIKVGETYGVRLKASDRSPIVPATVVSIDEPVSWKEWNRYGNREDIIRKPTGGIVVKFVKPTRVGWQQFTLASETNKNAGEIKETYVFHPHRNGGAAQVSKMFVGPWAEIVASRQAAAEAQRAEYAEAKATADYFEPVLDAYLARLAALGIRADTFSDFSGIHGDIDRTISTRRTDKAYSSSRPTGFSYGGVRVDPDLFDWLLQQAEATGEKWRAS